MTAKSINDPDTRAAVVARVADRDTLAVAAGVTGVSVSSIHRRRRSDKDFARELDEARRRADVVAHHAPRMLEDAGEPPPYTRDALLKLLWSHANDSESKGCAKALHVLAEYDLGAEVHARKLAAARDAAQLELDNDTSEPLQVHLTMPRPAQNPRAIVEISARETS